MGELKSCPFCGGVAEVKSDFGYTSLFWVVCKRCGCKQEPSIHKEAVVEAWNTRKPMEAVVAELENKMLESSSAQSEAIIGMCGASANYYCGEKDAFAKAISIVRGKE